MNDDAQGNSVVVENAEQTLLQLAAAKKKMQSLLSPALLTKKQLRDLRDRNEKRREKKKEQEWGREIAPALNHTRTRAQAYTCTRSNIRPRSPAVSTPVSHSKLRSKLNSKIRFKAKSKVPSTGSSGRKKKGKKQKAPQCPLTKEKMTGAGVLSPTQRRKPKGATMTEAKRGEGDEPTLHDNGGRDGGGGGGGDGCGADDSSGGDKDDVWSNGSDAVWIEDVKEKTTEVQVRKRNRFVLHRKSSTSKTSEENESENENERNSDGTDMNMDMDRDMESASENGGDFSTQSHKTTDTDIKAIANAAGDDVNDHNIGSAPPSGDNSDNDGGRNTVSFDILSPMSPMTKLKHCRKGLVVSYLQHTNSMCTETNASVDSGLSPESEMVKRTGNAVVKEIGGKFGASSKNIKRARSGKENASPICKIHSNSRNASHRRSNSKDSARGDTRRMTRSQTRAMKGIRPRLGKLPLHAV